MAGSATMPEEQTDLLDAVPDGDAIPGGGAEEGEGYAIRSLLQTRYSQTWANGGGLLDRAASTGNDGYRLERGFLRFTDDPSKQVGIKILFDLAELTRKNTKGSVKLAYVRLRPRKRLEFTFGIQKRPFSLLELNPIASYELADRGNAGGAVTSFTGALNLLLPQGVRLLIDATHHSAQTGAYRSDGTAYLDSWTLVTQVQLLI